MRHFFYPLGYQTFTVPFNLTGSYEFHIRADIRHHYTAHDTFFSLNGNVILANHAAVRQFVNTANSLRPQHQAWYASDINAMGLIDEIFHLLLAHYKKKHPNIIELFHNYLINHIGEEATSQLILLFSQLFPPKPVYQNVVEHSTYLQQYHKDTLGTYIQLEELLLVVLANQNPAFAPYQELFRMDEIEQNPLYAGLPSLIDRFFSNCDKWHHSEFSVWQILHQPIDQYPSSLYDQLAYLLQHFTYILGSNFTQRILSSQDFMREDHKWGHHGGEAETQVYHYQSHGHDENESFTDDKHWMPNVVMIAKNALVWLHQLSMRYDRKITTLDAIPDAELDRLANSGINSLWLIGLWQRSTASKTIKNIMGNNLAEASAYSLDSHQIAYQLGGWSALFDLKQRASQRGIRLASDMVPNHTAMDSQWIAEQPHLFLQTSHCPFPTYTFGGQNLSHREGIGIYLEDHYYQRNDAAVVFKRIDEKTQEVRYIYHGNDGTATPWNDTAQLDFSKAETREAVIQEILNVARYFSIIRFDAAMVLVKKHIQRLWFPLPGKGGDIASRSDYAMSQADFDAMIPQEFWREVVDRIATELPDTLLLAEAFWMLEGYFVRSLGMHRVYNSAFMNMLKKEENAQYKQTIKNTQEFDSKILNRFVNFMSNPDEETAIEQFGRGDKYFGVCTLMATMPGLPMFAHGQLEGLTEKYGMEFSQARYHEDINHELWKRHEREIFPLLRRRYLFSGADNFRLYDFYCESYTNDNVFAYSNQHQNQHSLVFYNNYYNYTTGHIHSSSIYSYTDNQGQKQLGQQSLGQALGLHNESRSFVLMQDALTHLWYLYASTQIFSFGFHISLYGYEHKVFWNISEVFDDTGELADFCATYHNQGIVDFEKAFKKYRLRHLHWALTPLLHNQRGVATRLINLSYGQQNAKVIMNSILADLEISLASLRGLYQSTSSIQGMAEEAWYLLQRLMRMPYLLKQRAKLWSLIWQESFEVIVVVVTYVLTRILVSWRCHIEPESKGKPVSHIFDEWMLGELWQEMWQSHGFGQFYIYQPLVCTLLDQEPWDTYEWLSEYYQKLADAQYTSELWGFYEKNHRKLFDSKKTEYILTFFFLINFYDKMTDKTNTLQVQNLFERMYGGYIDTLTKLSKSHNDLMWFLQHDH